MKHDLQESAVDRVTTAIKLGVGIVGGPIGPIISEIIGSVIPNQRIDRIVRFIQLLDARLTELEVCLSEQDTTNPECVDILEDSFFQAARAVTNDRLERIASVVATGFSESELKYEETKRMLWLLQQLTDEEVVILRGRLPNSNVEGQADEHFQNLHANVLKPIDESRLRTQSDLESNAIHQSYRRHLDDLGLIGRTEGVSVLGRMLLKYLNMIPEWFRRPT